MSIEIKDEYNLKFKELMREGIKKYRRVFYDPYAPPLKLFFPEIFINSKVKKRISSFFDGKLKIHEGSGEYRMILNLCKELSKSIKRIKILDVGCANCDLADYLKSGHGLEFDYVGVDISSYCGEYPVVKTIDEVKEDNFDVIVMTHVAEHLELNNYINDFQEKIAKKLKANGHFIFSVPNPLNPRIYFGDLSHIQKFPWHQTYALLRFSFSCVNINRIENVNRIFDLIFLPLRIFTCRLVYLDVADVLLFVCKK